MQSSERPSQLSSTTPLAVTLLNAQLVVMRPPTELGPALVGAVVQAMASRLPTTRFVAGELTLTSADGRFVAQISEDRLTIAVRGPLESEILVDALTELLHALLPPLGMAESVRYVFTIDGTLSDDDIDASEYLHKESAFFDRVAESDAPFLGFGFRIVAAKDGRIFDDRVESYFAKPSSFFISSRLDSYGVASDSFDDFRTILLGWLERFSNRLPEVILDRHARVVAS